MRDRELALKLRVGVFVLIGLLLFAAFVLTIGGGSRFLEERYPLQTTFTSVEGLIVGAPVRLAGVTVGTVSAIRFSEDPVQKKLVVELSLDKRVQDRIREDSVASIGTIGLVGDKVLEITVGSPDKRVLPPGSLLASVDPPDYLKLLQKGDQILDNVVKVTGSLEELLSGLGEERTAREVVETVRTLKRTLNEVERGRGLLHSLVYEEKGRRLFDDLAEASRTLKRVAASVERGEGILSDLRRTVLTLEQAAVRTEKAASAIERFAAKAEKGEGLLFALLFDPKGRELIEDLKAVSQDLKAVTGK
ncbi:MAG: MlaD family protein, partial [Candidatus Methylomirabilales bacterium]